MPKNFLIYALLVFGLTTLLHWGLKPNIGILLYLAGAIIGMYLLDAAEKIVGQPSPFRSALVQVILWILAIFGLTSSAGFLGRGVILFINLRLLYLQLAEFKEQSNLDSWFANININLNPSRTKTYLYIVFIVFIIQAILFILV